LLASTWTSQTIRRKCLSRCWMSGERARWCTSWTGRRCLECGLQRMLPIQRQLGQPILSTSPCWLWHCRVVALSRCRAVALSSKAAFSSTYPSSDKTSFSLRRTSTVQGYCSLLSFRRDERRFIFVCVDWSGRRRLDCGARGNGLWERFQDGRGGRGEADWSASYLRMTAELCAGGGVCRCQMLLESQPGKALGMRSESGEWRGA